MKRLFTRFIMAAILFIASSGVALSNAFFINNFSTVYHARSFDFDLLTTPQRLNLLANDAAQAESYCMGLALYHEARGEPIDGQIVVAATILNRVRSSAYPDSVCGVVFENEHKLNRCQFSFACDQHNDEPKNEALFEDLIELGDVVASGAIYDSIPAEYQTFAFVLQNATHYHRFDIRTKWSPKLQALGKFGNHIFFKSKLVTRRYQARAQFFNVNQQNQNLVLASY